MNIFATDLDSTIIGNTYPSDINKYLCIGQIKRDKRYYISIDNLYKLKEISSNNLFIPITTRGIDSYSVLKLKDIGVKYDYALVDNGAILLKEGNIDTDWLRTSKVLFKDNEKDFKEGFSFLSKNGFYTKTNSEFTLDFIKDTIELQDRDKIYLELESLIGKTFDVFKAGTKGIYATAKKLNKGVSLKRFLQDKCYDKLVVAGDTKSDWSLMNLTKHSIGLSDSPAQMQFSKTKYDKDMYSYLDFVMDTAYNIFKG